MDEALDWGGPIGPLSVLESWPKLWRADPFTPATIRADRNNIVLQGTRGNKHNVQMGITFEHVRNSHRPIPTHANLRDWFPPSFPQLPSWTHYIPVHSHVRRGRYPRRGDPGDRPNLRMLLIKPQVKGTILDKAGFPKVEVAVWEWKTSFSGIGPKLQSLNPLVNGVVTEFARAPEDITEPERRRK